MPSFLMSFRRASDVRAAVRINRPDEPNLQARHGPCFPPLKKGGIEGGFPRRQTGRCRMSRGLWPRKPPLTPPFSKGEDQSPLRPLPAALRPVVFPETACRRTLRATPSPRRWVTASRQICKRRSPSGVRRAGLPPGHGAGTGRRAADPRRARLGPRRGVVGTVARAKKRCHRLVEAPSLGVKSQFVLEQGV